MSYIQLCKVPIVKILVLIVIIICCNSCAKNNDKDIVIAVVCENENKEEQEHKRKMKAFELYKEKNNNKKGNKKIWFNKYFDWNDTDRAKEITQEIIKNETKGPDVIIGHWTSQCSIAANKTYKKHKIPVITVGSTSLDVNKENPYYYRMIYTNNQEALYMMLYATKILKQNKITIIHEDEIYGKEISKYADGLKDILKITIKQIECPKSLTDYDALKDYLKIKFEETNLKEYMIILAVKVGLGAKLVHVIRDEGMNNIIMGPVGFSTDKFLSYFKESKRKFTPSYYCNGIYVTSPLLYDRAGKKSQNFIKEYMEKYKEKPHWEDAYYYHTLELITNGVEKYFNSDKLNTQNYRQSIIEYLNQKSKKFKGASGNFVFDQKRNAKRNVQFGVYRKDTLVSSLKQIEVNIDYNNFDINNKEQMNHMIIALNESFTVTNYVYTGIKINNIIPINTKDMIFYFDFYLWFKFKGDIAPQNVRFLNQLQKYSKEKVIEKEFEEGFKYYSYRYKGSFKDLFDPLYNKNEYKIGFSFHNKSSPSNKLIYVKDGIGMGLDSDIDLCKKMMQEQILNPKYNYSITKFSYYQEDEFKTNAFGNIANTHSSNKTIEFSRMNVEITIKKNAFDALDYFPKKIPIIIITFITSFILFLCIFVLIYTKYFSKRLRLLWLGLQLGLLFFGCCMILSIEAILQQILERYQVTEMIKCGREAIIFIWCIFWPFIIYQSINCILWIYIENKSEDQKFHNHKQLSILTMIVLSLISILSILSFVFDINVMSIIFLGGIVTTIISWAFKIKISDLVSSIILNIDNAFFTKDWIKIDKYEGEVLDINFKSTVIKSTASEIIYIPNRLVTQTPVYNYDYRDDSNKLNDNDLEIIVHIDPNEQSEKVRNVLNDALSSAISAKDSILKIDSKKQVVFKKFTHISADYSIHFRLDKFGKRHEAIRSLWEHILTHMKKNNVSPAFKGKDQFQNVSFLE